ncbi:uncharacterized protein [Leishmania mexicana MHOM/GT/2001/U1103]|uniref:Uncharacterized protein n=1 Tax=Leishmania mexicana (strain MHOM/GT/2001/U1103) TaxID=929439 RepID=E8NHL7_LEIMU|nr:uncharacterized protein [Leishmania mexicana MHOM/GT/2001/U1103]CBZ40992.1 unnamed protein product [Leishmania mexicana MHOM/GT/2001/U1103]
MKYNTFLLLYVALQFVAFLLVLVATPLDMFRRRRSVPGFSLTCITLWGFKFDCDSSDYSLTLDVFSTGCISRVYRFRAAQGLAVISIFVYGAAFVGGLILLFGCCFLRLVCLALNIVSIATLCVVWALMVVSYFKNDGPNCSSLTEGNIYGRGFILFVIAWILDIINTIILLLPCMIPDTNAKETMEVPAAKA